MIFDVIPLLGAFFSSGIFEYVLVHILSLAFIATVPIIIISLFWR